MTESEIILTLEDRWLSKEEVMALTGLTERAARDYMADLNERLMAYNKCVVSTATRAGFHIPNPLNPEDLAIVRRAAREVHSKSMSLLVKEKAFNNFLQYAESAKDAEKEIQGSLF